MITLRYKKLKPDKYSIYLDYFVKDVTGNKQRKSEYLRLYVSRDYLNNRKVLNQDKEVMELARQIRSKRELELLGSLGSGGLGGSGRTVNQSLLEYIEHQVTHFGKGHYNLLTNRLKLFTNKKDIALSSVTLFFIEKFFKHIQKHSSRNNAVKITCLLRAIINKACNEKILDENPFERYNIPGKTDSERTTLELHEIRLLRETDTFIDKEVKQLFLLGCFTGLRLEDLKRLHYSDIVTAIDQNQQVYKKLVIRPHKTKKTSGKLLELPLPEQALEILNEMSNGKAGSKKDGKVFKNLPSYGVINRQLKAWGNDAGIGKKLHMHAARHTFASLCLSSGIDLYTTGKLLGHDKLQNTEKYAKLLGDKLQEEIQKFPDLMLNPNPSPNLSGHDKTTLQKIEKRKIQLVS